MPERHPLHRRRQVGVLQLPRPLAEGHDRRQRGELRVAPEVAPVGRVGQRGLGRAADDVGRDVAGAGGGDVEHVHRDPVGVLVEDLAAAVDRVVDADEVAGHRVGGVADDDEVTVVVQRLLQGVPVAVAVQVGRVQHGVLLDTVHAPLAGLFHVPPHGLRVRGVQHVRLTLRELRLGHLDRQEVALGQRLGGERAVVGVGRHLEVVARAEQQDHAVVGEELLQRVRVGVARVGQAVVAAGLGFRVPHAEAVRRPLGGVAARARPEAGAHHAPLERVAVLLERLDGLGHRRLVGVPGQRPVRLPAQPEHLRPGPDVGVAVPVPYVAVVGVDPLEVGGGEVVEALRGIDAAQPVLRRGQADPLLPLVEEHLGEALLGEDHEGGDEPLAAALVGEVVEDDAGQLGRPARLDLAAARGVLVGLAVGVRAVVAEPVRGRHRPGAEVRAPIGGDLHVAGGRLHLDPHLRAGLQGDVEHGRAARPAGEFRGGGVGVTDAQAGLGVGGGDHGAVAPGERVPEAGLLNGHAVAVAGDDDGVAGVGDRAGSRLGRYGRRRGCDGGEQDKRDE